MIGYPWLKTQSRFLLLWRASPSPDWEVYRQYPGERPEYLGALIATRLKFNSSQERLFLVDSYNSMQIGKIPSHPSKWSKLLKRGPPPLYPLKPGSPVVASLAIATAAKVKPPSASVKVQLLVTAIFDNRVLAFWENQSGCPLVWTREGSTTVARTRQIEACDWPALKADDTDILKIAALLRRLTSKKLVL